VVVPEAAIHVVPTRRRPATVIKAAIVLRLGYTNRQQAQQSARQRCRNLQTHDLT
jgi:hypothetical protein